MDKHTPGPWNCVRASAAGHDIVTSEVMPVDICVVSRAGKPKTEIDANARLIATAPELLEALDTLVKRIEFYSSLGEQAQPNIEQWEYTEGSSDMAAARAALSKARGEQV